MDVIERQLLEFLAAHEGGRAMVCSPEFCAAAERLAFDNRRLVCDVYTGPEGSVLLRITPAGLASLNDPQ